MRIIILDENFDTIGAVSVFNSLIWTRRYYDVGVFELHVPVEYFELLNAGKYVYRNDRTELGVIREVIFAREDNGARTASCKGYFAEDILNARVIDIQQDITGKPWAIANALLTTYFVSPKDTDRKIENIKIGDDPDLGESVRLTVTGDTVGEKLFEIEKTQEMSHRLRYDYLTNDLTYELWKGKDRTDSQTETPGRSSRTAFTT